MPTPLRALKTGLLALPGAIVLTPFDLYRRHPHPEVAHPHRTVLTTAGGSTHPDVTAHQRLRLSLACYHANEKAAYEAAVALYDTLTTTFGPPGSETNTWTLTTEDVTPLPCYQVRDILASPPTLVGALPDEQLVLATVTLTLRLSPL